MIKINSYTVGVVQTNCYLVVDTETNTGLIIDPGGKSSKLEEDLQNLDSVEYILLTHGHFDHTLKTAEYQALTNAKIVMGANEKEFAHNQDLNLYRKGIDVFTPDILANDGDFLKFGSTQIKIISTPGHTKGSVCYIINSNIFSGDTLFNRGVGRTDFITGDNIALKASLKKLYSLEEDYTVYPGHGYLTTLFSEKNNNTGLAKESSIKGFKITNN